MLIHRKSCNLFDLYKHDKSLKMNTIILLSSYTSEKCTFDLYKCDKVLKCTQFFIEQLHCKNCTKYETWARYHRFQFLCVFHTVGHL